ncbi:MAG: hypothetical protein JW841_10680 [Deltaproteobacteria bacterium]|nr:hypothetical protein [Deltaproteobacteria bacterium]
MLKIGASGTYAGNVTQYKNNYTTNLNNASIVQEIRDRVQLSAQSVLEGWTFIRPPVSKSYFSNNENVALALSMDFATEISEEFGAFMGQINTMDEATFNSQLRSLYNNLPTSPEDIRRKALLMLQALACLPNVPTSEVIDGDTTSIHFVNRIIGLYNVAIS